MLTSKGSERVTWIGHCMLLSGQKISLYIFIRRRQTFPNQQQRKSKTLFWRLLPWPSSKASYMQKSVRTADWKESYRWQLNMTTGHAPDEQYLSSTRQSQIEASVKILTSDPSARASKRLWLRKLRLHATARATAKPVRPMGGHGGTDINFGSVLPSQAPFSQRNVQKGCM